MEEFQKNQQETIGEPTKSPEAPIEQVQSELTLQPQDQVKAEEEKVEENQELKPKTSSVEHFEKLKGEFLEEMR